MNDQANDYYSEFSEVDPESGHFHKVITLHGNADLQWDKISSLAPLLPRGWFELSRLSKADRIEFTRDYWLSKLVYTHPCESLLGEKIGQFFEDLEDIGILISQITPDAPFDAHMVYSLKEERGFFHGSPPASKESLAALIRQFPHVTFPLDYLSFFEVHDGFCKYVDTGLLKARDLARIYQKFQQLLGKEVLLGPDGEIINPHSLIPFYESFGLHSYQCFYTDWYAEEEIGNVFYSDSDKSISNFYDSTHLEENLAFTSFSSWLLFYLEDVFS